MRILDEQGELLAEASGLQLQRSVPLTQTSQPTPSTSETGLEDWLYELQWQPTTLLSSTTATQPGHWLIFADGQGVGEQLGTLLASQGHSYTSIIPANSYQVMSQGYYHVNPTSVEDIRRVIEEVSTASSAPLRGVIHLWSLDSTPVAVTQPSIPGSRSGTPVWQRTQSDPGTYRHRINRATPVAGDTRRTSN